MARNGLRVNTKRGPPPPPHTAAPTAVRTAAPGAVVSFVSPVNGQTLGGSISVALSFSSVPSSTNPNSVWWTRLSVDGAPVVDGYNNLPWNTTTVGNGSHTMRVDGFAYNSSTSIGSATIGVTVSNSVSTPSGTPTPVPTVAPAPPATPTKVATPTVAPAPH